MTAITKVKMFNGFKYIDLDILESDINKFIENKDVKSIQYQLSKNRYTAMVVYTVTTI